MGKMCRRILSAISLNPLHNGKQSPQRNLRDVEHPVGRMLTLWKISARLGRSLALPFGRRTMVCRLHSLVRGAWEVEAWRFNRGLHPEEGKRVANRSIATVGRFHRICKL